MDTEKDQDTEKKLDTKMETETEQVMNTEKEQELCSRDAAAPLGSTDISILLEKVPQLQEDGRKDAVADRAASREGLAVLGARLAQRDEAGEQCSSLVKDLFARVRALESRSSRSSSGGRLAGHGRARDRLRHLGSLPEDPELRDHHFLSTDEDLQGMTAVQSGTETFDCDKGVPIEQANDFTSVWAQTPTGSTTAS